METNPGAPLSPESIKVFETLPYRCLVLSPDFRVLTASDAYLKLVGKSRAVMLGWNVFEFHKQNANWLRAMEAGLESSMQLALETRQQHTMPVIKFYIPNWDDPESTTTESYWKISHTPVCNDAAEVLYLIHDILNITAQVTYEQQLKGTNVALKDSVEALATVNDELEARVKARTSALQLLQEQAQNERDRLRFLLDAIPQQVWTTDPNSVLLAVNTKLCRELGHSSDEIHQLGLRAFVHPEDLQRIEPDWAASLDSAQAFEAEYRIRFADGIYRWHLARAVPMIEDGRVSFWLGTNTNIDQQKENEQRKDEFLSIASHELKTPLTSIKSFNQLMNRVSEGRQMGVYLQKSYNNILRLEKLINDLLDVTKINAGKMNYDMQPFDFLEMMRETIENVQLTLGSHEIILNSCEPFALTGDRLRLEQVLINLLDNAIKYSPGGEEVLVRVNLEEAHVVVGVQDYGVGIDKKNLEKLFNRYYRTENTAMRFEGLGLGLFISAEIVSRHHGTYWLESELGSGSTFYFRLPLQQEAGTTTVTDVFQ